MVWLFCLIFLLLHTLQAVYFETDIDAGFFKILDVVGPRLQAATPKVLDRKGYVCTKPLDHILAFNARRVTVVVLWVFDKLVFTGVFAFGVLRHVHQDRRLFNLAPSEVRVPCITGVFERLCFKAGVISSTPCTVVQNLDRDRLCGGCGVCCCHFFDLLYSLI